MPDLHRRVEEIERLKAEVERLTAQLAEAEGDRRRLREALVYIDDTLGFYQGDYEPRSDAPGAHQVVVINADDDGGDYQRMLYACRAAMADGEGKGDG